MTETILCMESITKTFPGVTALENVSFDLRHGEVHALVGENGAGKSTLIKILAGVYPPDAGVITLDGNQITIRDPRHAQQLGISIIYQEFNLCANLTVQENILLGHEPAGKFGLLDNRAQHQASLGLLAQIGVELDPKEKVGRLGVAQRQMVEIAKALALDARIIVMDEPSAALTEQEQDALYKLVCSLKERGISVIYISHRLEEIFHIADRVTVLKDGQVVSTMQVSQTSIDQLVTMMVGREIGELFPTRGTVRPEVVLSVNKLCKAPQLREISFELHSGEVLGIAGLVGSGRTELARCIFGVDKRDLGIIAILDRTIQARSPR